MKKFLVKRILAGVLLMALLLLGGAFFIGKNYVRGIDLLSTCGESIEREAISPDKTHIAVVYLRNCGATTDYVTHLNLRKTNKIDKPNTYGVILDGEVLSLLGHQRIEVAWKDNEILQVQVPSKSILTHKNVDWNSIHIKFVGFEINELKGPG